MRTTTQEPKVLAPPTACPFCRSASLKTVSKQVDTSTYWRCETCGQVWNFERLLAANRNGYGGR